MTRMDTRSIADTRVYAQEPEPTDKRDGVLWVDTGENPPATKVRDADAGTWEPVASGAVTVQDSEPGGVNEGHIWVDTSAAPPVMKVRDADNSQWVAPVPDTAEYSRQNNYQYRGRTDSSDGPDSIGYVSDGVRFLQRGTSGSVDIEIRFDDADGAYHDMISLSVGSGATEDVVFPQQIISEIEVVGGSGEVDPYVNRPGVANHSHSL